MWSLILKHFTSLIGKRVVGRLYSGKLVYGSTSTKRSSKTIWELLRFMREQHKQAIHICSVHTRAGLPWVHCGVLITQSTDNIHLQSPHWRKRHCAGVLYCKRRTCISLLLMIVEDFLAVCNHVSVWEGCEIWCVKTLKV